MEHLKLDRTKVTSLLLVLLGNIIYSFAIKLFLLPAELISCGTTGIGLVVEHFLHIPLSGFIFVFNMVMLAVGWLILGRKFAMTTLLSSLLYPIFLEILNQTLGDVYVTDNLMLNAIFAGIGLGGSLGIVIRAGASTGGMDIPPLVIRKFTGISVSVTLYAFDLVILLGQMFISNREQVLYGILMVCIYSVVLEEFLLMGKRQVQVRVVSSRWQEINRALLEELDRGVTLLMAEGGYSREKTLMVLSVVGQREVFRVTELVHRIDPEAFLIIEQVKEVRGRGFTAHKRYGYPAAFPAEQQEP